MGKEMSKILPGIYLGRLDNAQNDNDMMANCITHILSVHEPVKQKLHKCNSYEYLEINVKDDANACISKYFSKTNDFIHECRMKNGNVLIHCLAGVSRAPTIVIAYLITVYELSFQDAYNCLRAVRPAVKPIPAFIQQLTDFQLTEAFHERERMMKLFGDFESLYEDKKLLSELIIQYKNNETDDCYYMENSIDSTGSNQYYEEPFGLDELPNPDDFENFNENLKDIFGDRDDPKKQTSKQDRKTRLSPTPSPDRQSDIEEEIDIPGSIPIGNTLPIPGEIPINLGASSNDFRGRAHSRQSQAASTVDSNPILIRYGQTAPATVPLFFENSN